MRKPLGKWEGALTRSFQAATLIIPLFSAYCHAQAHDYCNTTPTIAAISPDTWVAGMTYNITITGTHFNAVPIIL
jgi:hypothetical protein